MNHPYATAPADIMAGIAQATGYAPAYVYCILRSFDNPKSPGNCRPSLAQLAQRAAMPVRTLRHHLAQLRQVGAIQVQAHGARAGGRAPNSYTFPDALTGSPIASNPPVGGNAAAHNPQDLPATPLPGNRQSNCQQPGTYVQAEDQEQTTPTPESPSFSESLAQLAPSAPEAVAVLAKYGAEIPASSLTVLLDQLEAIRSRCGPEPTRRAVLALAAAVHDGQRPREPAKLPSYAAPIFKRIVAQWRRDEQDRVIREENDRLRAQRAAAAAARPPTSGPAFSDAQRRRFGLLPPARSATERAAAEEAQRALLASQAAELRAARDSPDVTT